MSYRFTYLQKKNYFSLFKSLLSGLLFIFFLPAAAQQAPTNFVTGNQAVSPFSYSVSGYKNAPYTDTTTFSLHFGKKNAGEEGFNRIINSFQVDGRTYVRGGQGNLPFTKVVLKRLDNTHVSGNKSTAFFEVQSDQSDSTLYVTPEYVNDMESLINSYVFNRGSDNVFSNANGITLNNVERIDLIFEEGIKAPSDAGLLSRSGILIMERGGNDSFKFSVIKSLNSSDKQVENLGELKTADLATAWGSTGVDIQSVVFQRDEAHAGNLRPNQYLGAQTVHGTFISLEDMGVHVSEMIYGISIFANDVTDEDLVGMTAGYPNDTDGQSAVSGGLDFMAGGGFFSLANNVGGRVFHDAAPDPSSINSHTGGADGSETNGLQLYVSITSADSTVLATVPVENGGYTFYDVSDGNYRLVLHTLSSGASTSDLPDGWSSTGEGANATKDGAIDGALALAVPAAGGGSLIMNNFGINFTPAATAIKAEDDDFGTVTSDASYTTPTAIFANDSLNHLPVDPALVQLKVAGTVVSGPVALKDSVSGADAPGVWLNADGTVTVDAGTAPGTYTLNYTICEQANPDNCDDAVILIRVGTFDLALQKTVKPGQAAVFKEGEEVTFVITVKNEGTLDATNVEIVDYIPEGLTVVGSDWVVTDDKAKRTIAALPAGTETTLEITFLVSSDAKPSVRNAAEISAAGGGTDIDSVFDEDRNNDEQDEDDFDTAPITICKKGGNCLPVKTTRIK